MLLAIDTSTETAGVALADGGRTRGELSWLSGQNHTVELLPAVQHLLGQAKIGPASLEAVVVARGPGSFNGLRAGMATAKGLAYALSIPLVGIGTLEGEAYPYAITGLPICPIFDAGRGEIATATYQRKEGRWQTLEPEHITTLEALSHELASERSLFCGEITVAVASFLQERLGERAVIASGASLLRRAGFLAELGWKRLERGERDDVATLQPVYLRRPPGEK